MDIPAKRKEPTPLEMGEVKELKEVVSTDWAVETNKKMRRHFKFPNFKEALAFVVVLGQIAEELHHHPDISLGWGKVEVETSTHSIGALSKKDFDLAKRIDAAYAVYEE